MSANLQSYKVALQELLSATKQNNMIQAIEDLANAIGDLTKMAWATGQIVAPSQISAAGAASGQALIWNGSAWTPGSQAVVSFVTALPGSPADKDECVYEASAANKIYWRLKYKASIAKWVKIGGPPLNAYVAASEGTTSTTAVDLATVGPSIVVPLTGDYYITGFAVMGNNAGVASAITYLYCKIGAAAAGSLGTYVQEVAGGNQYDGGSLHRTFRGSCVSGETVKLQYAVSAGTGGWSFRDLYLDPIFVS